jgi:hypothetical protein
MVTYFALITILEVYSVMILQVMMERSFWMYKLSRLHPSYVPEIHRFIDAAKNHARRTKKMRIHCPCMDCRNVVVFDDTQQILSHLVHQGFMKDYLIWSKHGEGSSAPYTTGNPANIDVDGLDMLVGGFSSYTRHNNLTSMVQTPNMLCQMFLIMVSLEEMKVSELMSCQIIWLRKMQNS